MEEPSLPLPAPVADAPAQETAAPTAHWTAVLVVAVIVFIAQLLSGRRTV